MERRKRLKNKNRCNFAISVIEDKLSLEKEIKYIKSILLYADKIDISSFLLSTVKNILSIRNLNNIDNILEYFYFLKEFFKVIDNNIYLKIDNILLFMSKEQIKYFKKNGIPKEIKKGIENLCNDTINIFGVNNIYEIYNLIGKNILTVSNIYNSPFCDKPEEYFIEYYKNLQNSIKNSYPLFDKKTKDFILSMSELGMLDLSSIDRMSMKHGEFVDNTMLQLPSFDFLPIDEILDIKKSLIKYIDRFRGSMLKYTDEINSMPWDKDFKRECYMVYQKHIAPSIEELDELTKENSFIKNLGLNMKFDFKTDTLPTIGIGADLFGILENIFNYCSDNKILIGSISFALFNKSVLALIDKIKKDDVIRKNHLFFYYKAGKLIENKIK